jgi:hypothetical protein
MPEAAGGTASAGVGRSLGAEAGAGLCTGRTSAIGSGAGGR